MKTKFRLIKLEYCSPQMYSWKPMYLPPSIKTKGETIDDLLSYLIRSLITNNLMTYGELAKVFLRTTSGWENKEYLLKELVNNGGSKINDKENQNAIL